MESISESNRETYQGFVNEPFEDNPKRTNFFTTETKKLIIIISLSIIIISLITVILLLSTKKTEKKNPIICDDGYYLPEDDKSHCLQCSENHCKKCHGTKKSNICTSCFYGYIIDNNTFNNTCEENHSIKAIYTTSIINETIYLIHYIYINNIKEMVIDNELVKPVDEYTQEIIQYIIYSTITWKH